MKINSDYLRIFLALLLCELVLAPVYSYSQGGVAINETGVTAHPSAMIDINSTTKGTLITRMTTAERNAIQSPADGLQIFNTTTRCLDIYISPVWQSIYCGCNSPAVPQSGVHIPTQTEIIWEWDDVPGATEYQWNTVNVYPGVGINTTTASSYTQTALVCNTAYALYVWAYNTCGNSSVLVLNQSTPACFSCGFNVTFSYNGTQETYGSVSRNGFCWLDRNLGASAVATSAGHYAAYGHLFQWGRCDDGHQLRNSGNTTTQSPTDVPGHANFINVLGDWRLTKNDMLWQGVAGINNPCPSGWRVPTASELSTERSSWTSDDLAGAFASTLKWSAGGTRDGGYSLQQEGSLGYYWSSTVSGANAGNLWFAVDYASITYNNRSNARSVRCIQDY